MSRVSRRANTKGPKRQKEAYQEWRRKSGMRDHEAERQEKLKQRIIKRS